MPAKYESLSYSDTTAEAKSAKRCCGVTLIAKISSFKEERELIRLCYEMNCICDDEFLLLYTGYESQNLELPYHSFSEFDLENFRDDECLAQFRLKKNPHSGTCEIIY